MKWLAHPKAATFITTPETMRGISSRFAAVLLFFAYFFLVWPEFSCTAQGVAKRKRGVPDVFTGSKLGSTEYNKEMTAIDKGRVDYATSQLIGMRRNNLLCVTFVGANGTTLPSLVHENIQLLHPVCDWALIFYNGDTKIIKKICNDVNVRGKHVHCRRSPATMQDRFMPNATDNTRTSVTLSVPKTVFYQELLPYLPRYKKVFLMDEDISLSGFNASQFLLFWACAFPVSPLIVQPLIYESNQYINYLNLNSWRRGTRNQIVASAAGLIEQQVPLFDAVFFEWFVKRVLVQTYNIALHHGVDWGHDRSWCNAAAMYAKYVLNYPEDYVHCAIFPQATPVHHYNHKSMSTKRDNRALFHANGVKVVQQYIDLFPTWVVVDVLVPNNPLDYRNYAMFRRVSSLNTTCLAQFK